MNLKSCFCMVHVQLCLRTRLTCDWESSLSQKLTRSLSTHPLSWRMSPSWAHPPSAKEQVSGAAQRISDRLLFSEHLVAQHTPAELENEWAVLQIIVYQAPGSTNQMSRSWLSSLVVGERQVSGYLKELASLQWDSPDTIPHDSIHQPHLSHLLHHYLVCC